MITLKPGAQLLILRSEMFGVWVGIELLFKKYGSHCMITCGTDGHPDDDPHTHGFAQDFHCHDVPQQNLQPLHQDLQDLLGDRYTVLYSDKLLGQAVYVDTPNAHFHIQLRKDLWHQIVQTERTSQ